MTRRARILKPNYGRCRGCRNFFVYQQVTKRKKFCSASCREVFFNKQFNALTAAARYVARMA